MILQSENDGFRSGSQHSKTPTGFSPETQLYNVEDNLDTDRVAQNEQQGIIAQLLIPGMLIIEPSFAVSGDQVSRVLSIDAISNNNEELDIQAILEPIAIIDRRTAEEVLDSIQYLYSNSRIPARNLSRFQSPYCYNFPARSHQRESRRLPLNTYISTHSPQEYALLLSEAAQNGYDINLGKFLETQGKYPMIVSLTKAEAFQVEQCVKLAELGYPTFKETLESIVSKGIPAYGATYGLDGFSSLFLQWGQTTINQREVQYCLKHQNNELQKTLYSSHGLDMAASIENLFGELVNRQDLSVWVWNVDRLSEVNAGAVTEIGVALADLSVDESYYCITTHLEQGTLPINEDLYQVKLNDHNIRPEKMGYKPYDSRVLRKYILWAFSTTWYYIPLFCQNIPYLINIGEKGRQLRWNR